jgi:GH35 family endo-1,4-beta-xylanase
MKFPICSRIVGRWFAVAVLAISGPQSLRDAADSAGMLVGAAVRPYLFSEAAYSATLAHEFNMVQPENAMKWPDLRPTASGFDFRDGDAVVRFAQAHGMKVRGHCLVWHQYNPDWLTQGHFTAAQLSHLLQEHIAAVMKHYSGQVFAWDVVNEALDENGRFKDLSTSCSSESSDSTSVTVVSSSAESAWCLQIYEVKTYVVDHHHMN